MAVITQERRRIGRGKRERGDWAFFVLSTCCWLICRAGSLPRLMIVCCCLVAVCCCRRVCTRERIGRLLLVRHGRRSWEAGDSAFVISLM